MKLMNRSRNGRGRVGFTLVETVAAMAVTSILLAGLGSMMIVASHAVPGRDSAVIASIDTERALAQLSEELATSLTVTERTADSIAFTVADRDGDGMAETIRYEWSGVAGQPLTRSYNGATAVNVVDAVTAFDLDYAITEIAGETVPTVTEGAEIQVVSQDAANAGVSSTFNISVNRLAAELIRPTLPAGSTGWRITRLMFQANPANPTSGQFAVEVRARSGTGSPATGVITSATVSESALVANNWYQVAFSNAGPLDPTLGAFVVFRDTAGAGTSGTLRIGTFSAATPNTTYYSTTDNAANWSSSTTTNIWLYVWAVPIQETAVPASASQYRLDQTHITLRTAESAVAATAPMLNRPHTTTP